MEKVRIFMATQEIILPEMSTCRNMQFEPSAQNLIEAAGGDTQSYMTIEVTAK